MAGSGMADPEPIRLPWSYSTYQILAVLIPLPLSLLSAWALITSPNPRLQFNFVIILCMVIFVAYAIIKTCSELKRGRIPKIAQLINLNITSSTPPQKLHRFILGIFFGQFLIIDFFMYSFAFDETLFLGIFLVLFALGMVGLGFTISALRIPDQPQSPE